VTKYPMPPKEVLETLRKGIVIPAHPLALTKDRRLDEERQGGLTRYYLSAGAGGLAVGVHTTQFEIHNPKVGLYRPVLKLAAETVEEYKSHALRKPIVMIAGICGSTRQAISEAEFAVEQGYHAGLLSLDAFKDATIDKIISHCRAVAEVIPIFGFYLQPAVGGRLLSYEFWRRFVEIENVVAIKIAPFNRYYTIDVIRAVAEAGRTDEIALYTGNDDNIVNDLITTFSFNVNNETVKVRIVSGLLGQWAFWTRKAVELLERIHAIMESNEPIPRDLLTLGAQITDANGAIFDAKHNFRGCIPGIHEILRRQGLLRGRWCINPNLDLSEGQMEEIDRVYKAYPHLNDDEFIAEHLDEWIG